MTHAGRPLAPELAAARVVTCPCGVVTARTLDASEALTRTSRHLRAVHCMPEPRALAEAAAAWDAAPRPEPEASAELPPDGPRLVESGATDERVRWKPWHGRARELVAAGCSDAEVGADVGLSRKAVAQWRRREGIRGLPPSEGGRRRADRRASPGSRPPSPRAAAPP